jgi:hypothetical protein
VPRLLIYTQNIFSSLVSNSWNYFTLIFISPLHSVSVSPIVPLHDAAESQIVPLFVVAGGHTYLSTAKRGGGIKSMIFAKIFQLPDTTGVKSLLCIMRWES